MILYILIGILLTIILLMAWVLYSQRKMKNKNLLLALNSLESEFDVECHALIESIENHDNTYDVYKLLLTHMKEIKEKNTTFESLIQSHQNEYNNINEELTKNIHEMTHISHQMRTSLSGLLGFSQFLSLTPMTENQKEFSSIIDASANELLNLVNSILDTNKLSYLQNQNMPDTSKNISNNEVENQIPLSMNILVVDDNPINQKLLSKMLENLNLKVTFAFDGKEAMALSEEHMFDMIFMDIEMPIMNGIDACINIRKLEKEYDKKAVPIVAVTANSKQSDIDTYFEAGMDDYIIKPIGVENVKKCVEKIYG